MRRTNSRISLFIAVFIVAGLALLMVASLGGPTQVVSAASPAVQITPNSGSYGTETVVTGQGFAPHEQVAIYKQTRPFFAYNTDSTGSFRGVQHPLVGPGPASGIITITATGRTSGLKATTTFTVTQ